MTTEMTCAMLCYSAGIATGAGAAVWLSARAAWISGVRRWKDRKHGRAHWQLTYRSDPKAGLGQDRGSCAVREPLTTSL